MHRLPKTLPLLLALAALAPAAPPQAGEGPLIIVPDVCLLPEEAGVSVPVVLSGAPELRPSSLRTTLLYDPAQVVPEEVQGAAGLQMTSTIDAEAGRVDLIWHTPGQLPVPPLPAGVLARIDFRVIDAVSREPRLDLDAGETRSLDANGRPSSVAVAGPATLVQGSGGLWIDVLPEGKTTVVESHGLALRGTPWILRGWSGPETHAGQRTLPERLEPLATTSDGRLASDDQDPGPGGMFYYLAARDDGTGRPVLGFDSTCRPRPTLPARAAAR